MREVTTPLSRRRVLSLLGIDVTLCALLSIAANLIQILTFKNGAIIFATIFFASLVFIVFQFFIHQKQSITILNRKLDSKTKENITLQKILRRLLAEFRVKSSVNVNPELVNVWVSTKKFQRFGKQVNITDVIEPNIMVIDKGTADGLHYGMNFSIYEKGSIRTSIPA